LSPTRLHSLAPATAPKVSHQCCRPRMSGSGRECLHLLDQFAATRWREYAHPNVWGINYRYRCIQGSRHWRWLLRSPGYPRLPLPAARKQYDV